MAARREQRLTGRLGDALAALARALSVLPEPGMIIGGIAVIARGVPRVTRDIDATIAGGQLPLPELLERWKYYDLVPRTPDAVEFAHDSQVLLLRHEPSGVDIDVSLAWLPFELEALAAAETVVIDGLRVAMATVEDLLVYKAVAFRPQDQQDIERLVSLHSGEIDLERVRAIVREFAEALEEPERVQELDRIVERARE